MLDKALCKVGNFSYRFRYLVLTVAVLLFVGVSVLQAFAGVSYSYSDYNKVTEVFPEDDTLVIVYDNKDEGKIKTLAEELKIEFADPGKRLLDKKGKILESYFTDGLHPNADGYKIIAEDFE